MNSDELTTLAMDLENPKTTSTVTDVFVPAPAAQGPAGDKPAWPPGRYYSVVFLQDEEGHAVVELLDQKGTMPRSSTWPSGTSGPRR